MRINLLHSDICGARRRENFSRLLLPLYPSVHQYRREPLSFGISSLDKYQACHVHLRHHFRISSHQATFRPYTCSLAQLHGRHFTTQCIDLEFTREYFPWQQDLYLFVPIEGGNGYS